MVADSSSSSDYDIPLGACQEETPAPSTNAAFSSAFHSVEVVCLRNRIDSPISTRHSGRTTFQCKFVKVLVFFKKIIT